MPDKVFWDAFFAFILKLLDRAGKTMTPEDIAAVTKHIETQVATLKGLAADPNVPPKSE